MTQKTTNIIGWILSILVALLLVFSAFMKLLGTEQAMKGAASLGLSMHKMKLLGIVELCSALLFIIPRTGVLGTLLLAAYVGGAIATHIEHYIPYFGPVILECLIWIAATLRFPELSKRLMGKSVV